jgi:hypothetical protein
VGNPGPLKQKYPSAYYCYRQDYGYPVHHYMMADGIQTQHSTKAEVIELCKKYNAKHNLPNVTL